MTALLSLDRISRRFDDGTLALDDISLEIPEGRTTVLLGASGCGKTTVLRLLSGLDVATSGQLTCTGRSVRIGYVFQAPALMPWATVRQNAALPLAAAGQADDARVMAALAQVGLETRADARPHALSGGMQMRVSIARALVAEPALLLLDEPFAALDEVTRQDLQALVASLSAARGLTVVLVTHSVSEAAFMADRIALMTPHPGRIASVEETGAPSPRVDAWRQDPRYGALCVRLSAALRATMTRKGTP